MNNDIPEVYSIAYDCKLHKVGCVLIQAGLGATLPRRLFDRFFADVDTWLVEVTPDMKLYRITEPQLRQLASRTVLPRKPK